MMMNANAGNNNSSGMPSYIGGLYEPDGFGSSSGKGQAPGLGTPSGLGGLGGPGGPGGFSPGGSGGLGALGGGLGAPSQHKGGHGGSDAGIDKDVMRPEVCEAMFPMVAWLGNYGMHIYHWSGD